jgi:hypothetical protein
MPCALLCPRTPAHNTRRDGRPFAGGPGRSGRGYAVSYVRACSGMYIRQGGPGLFVLLILPAGLLVFDPVLVLLAVGHGGSF